MNRFDTWAAVTCEDMSWGGIANRMFRRYGRAIVTLSFTPTGQWTLVEMLIKGDQTKDFADLTNNSRVAYDKIKDETQHQFWLAS